MMPHQLLALYRKPKPVRIIKKVQEKEYYFKPLLVNTVCIDIRVTLKLNQRLSRLKTFSFVTFAISQFGRIELRKTIAYHTASLCLAAK